MQDVSTAAFKFIKRMNNSGFRVKSLLIMAKTPLHPKVKLQRDIRERVFVKEKYPINLQNSTCLKTIYIFFQRIMRKYLNLRLLLMKVRIAEIDNEWNNCSEFSNDITVVYSLEGLIPEKAIRQFNKGIINIHPAILPEFRGLDGGLWAIHEESELGVTAYLIDKGIDTGSIIDYYRMNYEDFEGLSDYRNKLKILKYNSFENAVKKYVNEGLLNEKPLIKREQNRGLMSEKTISELILRHGA